MKTIFASVLAIALVTSPASAFNCYTDGSNTSCYSSTGNYQTFGDSLTAGYLDGLNVASQYSMVNAYREAHGLPRCHYGIWGAILSAGDGRPMC